MAPVEGMHWQKVSEGDAWTKADVVANNRLKFELFRRFGVLPGASDTHIAEFFPGFVTQASDFGRDWGVHHYGLRGHQQDKEADDREVAELLAGDEVSPWPSGELVAELIEGVVTGTERNLPDEPAQPRSGGEPPRRTWWWSASGSPEPPGSGPGTPPASVRCWASTCDRSPRRRSSPSTPR